MGFVVSYFMFSDSRLECKFLMRKKYMSIVFEKNRHEQLKEDRCSIYFLSLPVKGLPLYTEILPITLDYILYVKGI